MTALRTVDLILVGLGNVHRQFLSLLATRQEVLTQRYGLRLRVVGACDSRGAAAAQQGIDPAALLAHKLAGNHVDTFPGGQPGATALDLLGQTPAHALLEASPVNLRNAQPALRFVRGAIERGMDVVLANKAPLALAYADVQRLARQHRVRLAFSATVCGGLPVVNVGVRDLVAANVRRVEGIFNSTSNYILTQMAAGHSYADALAEAQRRGIAEADPSLDVDGWDTANKLTIVANAVLGFSATVGDVRPVVGIRGLSPSPGPSLQGGEGAPSPGPSLQGGEGAPSPGPSLQGGEGAPSPGPSLQGGEGAPSPGPSLQGGEGAPSPGPSLQGGEGAPSPGPSLEGGGAWKLLGVAERRTDGGYDLSVQPVWLRPEHRLARVNGWEMGVVFESDLFETVFITIDERGPTGTAAAMLRDVVNLYRADCRV